MKQLGTFTLLSVFPLLISAQSIKSLDYSSDYKKNGVSLRYCIEVKFEGTEADSIPINKTEFDANGRIIQYTEYFAGGRKLSVQNFSYNSEGKLITSCVSHAFNNWESVELIHIYDAKGKLLRRECPIEIRNFWKTEKYTYDSSSKIKEVVWSRENDGRLEEYKMETYSAAVHSGENTPNYIHDANGLLIIHRIMDNSGVSQRQRVYRYEY